MKSYKTLKKKLDDTHSLWIRLKNANDEGMVSCVTCPAFKHYKEVDCGHFITRSRLSIRWDEKNTAVQCKKCNGFGNGEQYKFGQWIDRRYGEGTVKKLEALSHISIKLTRVDLQEMIEETEAKLMAL